MRAALVADDGSILRRAKERTPREDAEPTALVRLMGEVSEGADVEHAVIGVPGVVDHDAEALRHAPNLPQSWVPGLSEAWLSERSGLAVSMANDCDLAAVGEASFGAGKACRDVAYVTISTGIGAGIVLNRKLMRGRFSGGEVGHAVVNRSIAMDGGDGTSEGQGSGTAIMRAAREAGITVEGAELADLVRSGDPTACGIWNNGIEAAAFGIVNLCWFVAPEMVVVGGGLGMNSDIVLPLIQERLTTFGPDVADTQVVPAALGDDAALCGGAAWWDSIGRS